MKKLVIGMLAHVDAGKTTLSESILYTSGAIRKLGRVDNKDAFLDNNDYERQRGITIFSKQAVFTYKDLDVTLLDTPGHVDFSAEMERTLWVLDYAVLVINGMDGVQGHTETLWGLLKRLKVPVFIFVNKMDQQGTDRHRILEQLKNKLSSGCVDFDRLDYEELAVCNEEALEQVLDEGIVDDKLIGNMISQREVFPVIFGSALRLDGVDRLLDIMNKYCEVSENGDDKQSDMSARVYKISRDDRGERLTHIKVTGGSLKAKQLINGEKINQIRIYSGEKYTSVNEAVCGSICAITGLEGTYAGQALGRENNDNASVLSPVLNYKINLPAGTDPLMMLPKLKMIEEEEPQLHIEWNESFKEIHVQVMGPVMIEVLQNIIKERFDCDVTFSEGSIVYKETIADKVEGIGHFEPLRHYAEVHLILEPGEAGSGMQYELDCSDDMLAKNWQRLIYTHLCEKTHKGVLTGSALTDVKITVVAGRAHNKHTEGGDFRQATYRAVRNGLMQAESVLLEPFYEFTLILDRQYIGRAMTDFERMGAQFEINDNGDEAVIKGAGPVATVGNYQAEVNAYTRGKGVLRLKMSGYRPCHNTDEVIEQIGYEAERDTRNPADSVFCAHGSGFNVPWYEVKDYAHVDSVLNPVGTNENVVLTPKEAARTVSDEWIGTDEVDRILAQTYFANSRGDNERRKMSKRKASDEMGRYVTASGSGSYNNGQYKASQSKKQTNSISYLLVDGYNIIHAWSELEELSRINMDSARDKLLDIMCNYQGMKKCELIVVFDAYRVSGHHEEYMDYHNIHVVYTKEAETADHYIEKFAHENGKKYNITVATSDGLEQVIIRGAGCLLYSAREFEKEVKAMEEHIRSDYLNRTY